MKIYNIAKLYTELKAAGIPIHGFNNCQNATVCFASEATEEQKAQAETIKEAHIPYDYREMRQKEYPPIGDQLDRLYKGMKAAKTGNAAQEIQEINTWIENIDNVKNKWTKNYYELTEENKAIADEYYERKFRR